MVRVPDVRTCPCLLFHRYALYCCHENGLIKISEKPATWRGRRGALATKTIDSQHPDPRPSGYVGVENHMARIVYLEFCDDWHEQYRIAADICHTATNVTIKSKHVMDRKKVNKIATGGSLYTCHCRHRQTVFYVLLLGFNATWLMVHKSRATFFIFHQEQYVALSITIVTPAWPWIGVESGGSVRFQEMRPGCTIRGWSRQVLLALFWLVFHE